MCGGKPCRPRTVRSSLSDPAAAAGRLRRQVRPIHTGLRHEWLLMPPSVAMSGPSHIGDGKELPHSVLFDEGEVIDVVAFRSTIDM